MKEGAGGSGQGTGCSKGILFALGAHRQRGKGELCFYGYSWPWVKLLEKEGVHSVSALLLTLPFCGIQMTITFLQPRVLFLGPIETEKNPKLELD
jgi:hypothetical protein